MTAPVPPVDLDQLETTLAAATPGPWYLEQPDRLSAGNEDGVLLFDYRDVVLVEDDSVGTETCTADAAAIVAAVNASNGLVAVARAALAARDALHEWGDDLTPEQVRTLRSALDEGCKVL